MEPEDRGPDPEERESLDVRGLTWAALLGHWVDFARTAVGLPRDERGQAMRAIVPDIIMLQAVWFALDELADLPPSEQALGVDRAGVLIERHRAAIERDWPRADWPDALTSLVQDVEQRWRDRLGDAGTGPAC